ncbi:MAG TPA: FAD-dependent oxidoreductase [Actinomycetes bacterium]|nr:FAD-dependent oxidoreductase [Actinomycetes bacterium]
MTDATFVNPAVASAVKEAEAAGPGDLPTRAQYVVVGGGVIGTSIAYHLTKLGAKDVLLLERQQLTSGTTWHAAGLIASGGTIDEDFAWMVRYSRDLYERIEQETGLSTGFKACGYLQLATTKRRFQSYRRETDFLNAYGVDKRVLSPAEVADLVPHVKTDDVIGGFYTPDEGRANPVDVAMSMARGARMGGARIVENCEVTGFLTSDGVCTGVKTERGDVEADRVVLASGLWGRELAAKAGVLVPLQAAEHEYLLTEPIDWVTPDMPIVEDPESYAYFREEVGGLLVGLFEPVAKPWSLDGTPKDSAFAVLPPDWERLTPFLETAMERFPGLSDVGIRTLFAGPESFTDDLTPMMGEAPELKNLYLACGMNSVGILFGGGMGHVVAQWLVDGVCPIDVTHVAVDRTHHYQATRRFRAERTVERLGLLLNDGAWPNWQPRTARNVRRSPLHDQHVADGAYFGVSAGWEYADWYGEPGTAPTVEWGFARGEAFERTKVESLNMRENVGAIDVSLMSKFEVAGPHAAAVLNRICTNDVDVAVGRLVYSPWLNEQGGIIADGTITRLAEDRYLVMVSDVIHRRVPAWIKTQTRDDEVVVVTDVTSGSALLSVQGPKSRELLQRLSPDDWSNEAFPYLTAQNIELGYTPLLALRVTYVGELGWDLMVPTEFAATLYDQLKEVGGDLGFRPTGMSSLSSMRLEKAYRDMGHDIDSKDNPLEAGLGFTVAWDKPGGFVGRDASLVAKEAGPPKRRLVQFLLSDPALDLFGGEPLYCDGEHVGYLSVGAFGHTLGGAVGLGMVERDRPIPAAEIAAGSWQVTVQGERTDATASLRPMFDPDRTRPNS